MESPEWIDSGAVLTDGLDLLGLRLPVQTIGGSLLDGVTTVTPSVRYLGFRAWLIYRYGEGHFPDIGSRYCEAVWIRKSWLYQVGIPESLPGYRKEDRSSKECRDGRKGRDPESRAE